MNQLQATITGIQQSGSVCLIDADVEGVSFSALLIESTPPSPWLVSGNRVKLVFKETEVSLARNLTGQISLRNRISCIVHSISRGEILSAVSMEFKGQLITSTITTRSVDALKIEIGDHVEAMIKANEVSLMICQI